MINPFTDDSQREVKDRQLVADAVKGSRSSLEQLIRRHQDWIYNIALRMVANPVDAEDVAQEVWLKIITKLSTFRGESSFRTWSYRIVANHVINMKKRNAEKHTVSFEKYWHEIERTPDLDIPDPAGLPVDLNLILEETRIQCMMGMLLCLDRQHRLVFILGEIFGVCDRIGSEILGISRDAFRKKLSRSRARLYQFMSEKCGLMKKENPCHCHRKVKSLLDEGEIDPQKLVLTDNCLFKVKKIAREKGDRLDRFLDTKGRRFFREHPFQRSPDFVKALDEILKSDEFQTILYERN